MMDIKALRQKYGLSRSELCRFLGIPYRTIQSWELGDRKPPGWVIKLVCEKLQELEK